MGRIVKYDSQRRRVTLELEEDVQRTLDQQESRHMALRIIDGRYISSKQRGKIFGITRDIARHYGYFEPFEWSEVRGALREEFCEKMELPHFSLSNCEKAVARDFISYLIDFCMRYNVEVTRHLRRYSDDFGKFLYSSLEHRKCARCGKPAQVHHVEAIGMGRDRDETVHEGMPCIALCAIHHTEAHNTGWQTYAARHHLAGLELDRYLCEKLGLRHN